MRQLVNMKDMMQLLKQAKAMQSKMKKAQEELATRTLEVSVGGGAVVLTLNGQGAFESIQLSETLLKEEVSLVEATVLSALKQAEEKVKKNMENMNEDLGMPKNLL